MTEKIAFEVRPKNRGKLRKVLFLRVKISDEQFSNCTGRQSVIPVCSIFITAFVREYNIITG